jgi:hypothetical protein
MSDPVTLQALLSTGADTAAAIGAPARTPLTHGELRAPDRTYRRPPQ